MSKYECACPIRPNMTYDELVEEVLRANKMCTTHWICSNLDKELRRADKERQYYQRKARKLAKDGHSREEISSIKMPKQPKHPTSIKPVTIDLSDL